MKTKIDKKEQQKQMDFWGCADANWNAKQRREYVQWMRSLNKAVDRLRDATMNTPEIWSIMLEIKEQTAKMPIFVK